MASTIEPEVNMDKSSEENQITTQETDETPSTTTTTRTAGQTAIGAKLVKKLETLGMCFSISLNNSFDFDEF